MAGVEAADCTEDTEINAKGTKGAKINAEAQSRGEALPRPEAQRKILCPL